MLFSSSPLKSGLNSRPFWLNKILLIFLFIPNEVFFFIYLLNVCKIGKGQGFRSGVGTPATFNKLQANFSIKFSNMSHRTV